mgnify:CR=1 FL=1
MAAALAHQIRTPLAAALLERAVGLDLAPLPQHAEAHRIFDPAFGVVEQPAFPRDDVLDRTDLGPAALAFLGVFRPIVVHLGKQAGHGPLWHLDVDLGLGTLQVSYLKWALWTSQVER